MQRWLKSITPDRDALEKFWCLKPFGRLGVDRGCWMFKRSSVIHAFSLGLLIAFIPPTPASPPAFDPVRVAWNIFRLNIPVLVATVFVSNPITWAPQIAGSIWVGAKLMGLDLGPVLHHMNHRNVWAHLSQLWQPLLLGALVLGCLAGALGYVLAKLLWRAYIVHQWRRRPWRSTLRRPAFDQNSLD